jgi:hypothetical protein
VTFMEREIVFPAGRPNGRIDLIQLPGPLWRS